MDKYLKALVIGAISFTVFYGVTRMVLGFSIFRIGAALDVSASMGAKLACSGYYLSGLNAQQNIDDLASYSPANRLLTINYDNGAKRVTANLKGLAEQSATYREGLGCTLDIGDTTALDSLQNTPLPPIAAAWPKGEQVDSIEPNIQNILDGLLQQDNLNGKQSRAMLVVKNGSIVAESYAEGFDQNSKLLGWSMGKSITAMMLGRLEQMGQVILDQTTGFPQWQNDARKDITLIDLLQMSSGIAFDETYAPGTDATNMLFHAHSASDVALTGTANHDIGSHFNYSSGTTNILSRWLYDHLGGAQQQLDFFKQEFLEPLGMRNTIFEVDPSGVYVGSSYIYASARDWARLGLLMLNNGNLHGQQLLSPEFVKAAQTPIDADNYQKYGYQFWLNSDMQDTRWERLPKDAYMMMGNRKQIVMIIPSENMVIVRLGWTSGSYPTEANFAQLIE